MATVEEVRLTINAAAFNRGVDQAQRRFSQFGQAGEKNIDLFNTKFGKLAAGFTGLFSAIGLVGQFTGLASAVDQKTQSLLGDQLGRSLRAGGTTTGGQAGALGRQALDAPGPLSILGRFGLALEATGAGLLRFVGIIDEDLAVAAEEWKQQVREAANETGAFAEGIAILARQRTGFEARVSQSDIPKIITAIEKGFGSAASGRARDIQRTIATKDADPVAVLRQLEKLLEGLVKTQQKSKALAAQANSIF